MNTQQRQEAMLQHALGDVVRDALAMPGTVEIMINADGRVWHERHGAPTVCIGTQDPRQTEATIRLVATLNRKSVSVDTPSIAGVLPGGQRFQGWIPPRTTGPAYCIRCHQTEVLTQHAYVPH